MAGGAAPDGAHPAATGRREASADPHADDALDQHGYRFRFDWGPMGLRRLAPSAGVVVLVDVLSFTTAVDVALGRGAEVLPYRWDDGSAAAHARGADAALAVPRGAAAAGGPGWSLSPASLVDLPAGTRLVLPSPNGAALAFGAGEAGARRVLAACLRNAGAVGRAAAAVGGTVAVVAAGERWRGATGPLRPAVEDLLGAGAVLAAAVGADTAACSPEALVALAAWQAMATEPGAVLADCGSGRQLEADGWGEDVRLASQVNVSGVVPQLRAGAFVDAATPAHP